MSFLRFTAFLCLLLLLLGSCDGMSYRLVNGNNTAGLLQAYSYISGVGYTWGTVCGSFNEAAATVACSSVGLSGFVGRVVPTSLFGVGYGQIQLADVNCGSATLSSLDYCQFSTQSITCGHDTDVSIACALPAQPGWSFKLRNDTFGALLFRTASTASWAPVCYSGSSQFLAAACRSLNPNLYSGYSSVSYVSTLPESFSSSLAVTQCYSGANVTLDMCVGAVGDGTSQCNSKFLTISRCQLVSYAMRQANMSDAFTGLLEVRPGDGFPWGTVCNKNISGFNPTVLCRIAGRPGTIGSIVPRPEGYDMMPASKPMYFSTMNCPTSGTSSTSSCVFSTDVGDCTHDMDVYLRCDLPSTPDASSWQFMVQSDALNSYAPILVRPNASAPWGGICSSLAGAAAMTACKSVGYPYNWYAYTSSQSVQSLGIPVYMYNVECDPKSRNVTECMFATTGGSCAYVVTLQCDTLSYSYQLTSGTQSARSTYGGLLQILPSGSSFGFGDVCADGTFSVANATTVCRLLFGGRVGLLTNRYGGSFLNRSMFSQFNCTSSTAGQLETCAIAVPTSPCASVVGINCVEPPATQIALEFSVAGSPTTNYQELRVRPNSTAPWLPLCSSWTVSDDTAASICSQLGYAATYVYTYSSVVANQSTPRYRTSSIYCPLGATSLQYCSQESATVDTVGYGASCSYGVMIYCDVSSQSSSYFLSGPSVTTGLLQTLASRGTSGTVCSLPSFTGNAPTVACATVGLPGYTGALRFVGAGSGSMASSLSCPFSNMTALTQCTPTVTTGCTHQNDVGVYCSVPQLTESSALEVMLDPSTSAVLVRRSANDAWGGVCYDTLDTNRAAFARAVCASIGLVNFSNSLSSNYTTVNVLGGGVNVLHKVACADVYNITNLGQCLYTTDAPSGGCRTFATVYCYTTDWDYDFVTGSDPSTGTVVTRPSEFAPWGSVCGKGVTSLAATYLCNVAGLRGYEGRVATIQGAFNGPVYQSNVMCSTVENAAPRCTFNYTSPNGCTSADAVWITCTKPAPREGWAYSLPSFGSSSYRPLLVKPSGASEWGYLSYSSSTNALVACMSVSPAVPTYARFSSTYISSATIYLSVWACSDDAQSLGDCLGNSTQYVTSGYVVTLACYYEPSAWQARLTNPQAPPNVVSSSGRLEVRPSSRAPWGTVCSVGFQPSPSICSQWLGTIGNGLVGQQVARFGAGSGTIYMSNLDCTGTNSGVGYCRYTNQTATARAGVCTPSSDLGVECVPPAARTDWTYEPAAGCDPSNSYCTVIARQQSSTNVSKLCYYGYSTGDSQFSYFTSSNAKAICASFGLGFGSYASYTATSDFSSDGRVVISCGSNISEVGNAQRCLQLPQSSCQNNYVVQVYCGTSGLQYGLANTRNTSTAVVGILTVSDVLGRRGVVCGTGLDATALALACSSLGLGGMVGRVSAVSIASTGLPLIAGSLNCSNLNRYSYNPTLVMCVTRPPDASCTTAAELACSLPSTTWNQQQQWSRGSYNVLYLRPNTSAPWGVVCANQMQISSQSGSSICSMLFPFYNAPVWSASLSSSYYNSGSNPVPVYASNVRCGLNATSLSNCDVAWYTGSPAACTYYASIMCYLSLSAFELRLRTISVPLSVVTATNSSVGVVELRPRISGNSLAWGTLCTSNAMTASTATSLCSLLGYPNSLGTFMTCPQGAAEQSFGMPIYARGGSCSSPDDCSAQPPEVSEQSLGVCSHWNDTCIACTPNKWAGSNGGRSVSPGDVTSSTWAVALQDRSNKDDGTRLLFVRPNASMAWGHVCNGTTLLGNEAAMFCRWLGCTDNCRAQWGTQYLGNRYAPVFVSRVRCPAGASDITACNFWEYTNASSTCAASDAVTLNCLPAYRPSVPPSVPYATLATNRAALFLVSSSDAVAALQTAISDMFHVEVVVSFVSSLDSASTSPVSVLVMFPSSTDRDAVVAAANDGQSAFSTDNPFVMGASTLSTSSPGAVASDEGSSNAGAIAGGVVGAIVLVAIVGLAAVHYNRRASAGDSKAEGRETMLSDFMLPHAASSVYGHPNAAQPAAAAYTPPQPHPLGHGAMPQSGPMPVNQQPPGNVDTNTPQGPAPHSIPSGTLETDGIEL